MDMATRINVIRKIQPKSALQTRSIEENHFRALFVFTCFWTSWFWPGTRSSLPKYYKKRCWWSRIGNTPGPRRWPILRRLPHQVCRHEKAHRATTFTLGSAPGSIGGSAFQTSVAAAGILWSAKCCSFVLFVFRKGNRWKKPRLGREVVESIILYPRYRTSCCY